MVVVSFAWFRSYQCKFPFFGYLRSHLWLRYDTWVYNPSATSLKPFLIPRELYANGATWTTIGWQSGVIIGPMLGGFMLAYLGRETSLLVLLPYSAPVLFLLIYCKTKLS